MATAVYLVSTDRTASSKGTLTLSRIIGLVNPDEPVAELEHVVAESQLQE